MVLKNDEDQIIYWKKKTKTIIIHRVSLLFVFPTLLPLLRIILTLRRLYGSAI